MSAVAETEYQLDIGYVWNIIGEISKPVQAELRASIDEEDQQDVMAMRRHLAAHYPPVFVACDAIEQAYSHAASMVTAQAQRLITVAKISLPSAAKREDEEKPQNKRAGKRTKAETGPKLVGFDAYTITDEEKQKAASQYFHKRDLWSVEEYSQDWLSRFVIPGSKIRPLEVVCQYDIYKTIYHCSGKWGMESLIDMLTDAGFRAIGLRDDVQKFEDVLRYKVITSEPFETEGANGRAN